jgi:hypothetical protein
LVEKLIQSINALEQLFIGVEKLFQCRMGTDLIFCAQ